MREKLVIPSRIARVCCSELKERRMPDAPYIVTGVRGAVDRRMDEHMTAHLHVGTGIASAARKKYDIIMTLL